MKSPSNPKGAGRPKKEIDWEEFDKLCALHCTLPEIAAWFECSDDTIETKVMEEFGIGFRKYYEAKSALGKISLRRLQWRLAQQGDKTMLVWLGKQNLAQAEKIEQNTYSIHLIEQAKSLSGLTKDQLIEEAKKEMERLKIDNAKSVPSEVDPKD